MQIPAAVSERVDPRVKAAWLDVVHRARWLRYPVRRVTRAFVRHHGSTVLAGPVAGLSYPPEAVERADVVVPKLLGAFEAELHPWLREVVSGGFEQIVDIGASEGYYAVGLARACPQARVVAYEMSPWPAKLLRALSERNGVGDRVERRGECTLAELAALPDRRTFVLSDCEGGEAVLLDPAAVPLLRSALVLVELHELAAPGVETLLRERFEGTHEVETVCSQPRYPVDYPALLEVPGISYMDHHLGLAEFRALRMKWAFMRPRAAP